MAGTVVVLGAGATKADGGPLTNEILPEAVRRRPFLEREGYIALLERFLVYGFHLPVRNRTIDHYPPLSLLLSLLDKAIDEKQPLGGLVSQEDLKVVLGPDFIQLLGSSNHLDFQMALRFIRDALEYSIFALLEDRLRRLKDRNCSRLIEGLSENGSEPVVISLNYDLIADNALMRASERLGEARFPTYGCDVATGIYGMRPRFGSLYKLHGSLNWVYCPNCTRLEVSIAESGRRVVKSLNVLYTGHEAGRHYACHGSPCEECGVFVRPVLITPTHLKDYRNPHIARIWYEAARALRAAGRVIFIGYSLPEDDVNVTYLLKRHVRVDDSSKITVVELDSKRQPLAKNRVGLRYRALFGDGIDWHPEGFREWLDSEPLRPRPSRRHTPRERASRKR